MNTQNITEVNFVVIATLILGLGFAVIYMQSLIRFIREWDEPVRTSESRLRELTALARFGGVTVLLTIAFVSPYALGYKDFMHGLSDAIKHIINYPGGTVGICFVLGMFAYILRSRARIVYGVIEIGVGIILTYISSNAVGNDVPLQLIAGIYVIVRGFDNIEKGIKTTIFCTLDGSLCLDRRYSATKLATQHILRSSRPGGRGRARSAAEALSSSPCWATQFGLPHSLLLVIIHHSAISRGSIRQSITAVPSAELSAHYRRDRHALAWGEVLPDFVLGVLDRQDARWVDDTGLNRRPA